MFKRILVLIDARPVSALAVAEGLALARAQGAEVLFFSVVPRYTVPLADMPPMAMVDPEDFGREARAGLETLQAQAAELAERAGVMFRHVVASGEDEVRCIVDAATERRCDAIVVASEGRNALMRLLTGSVIPGLITVAPMPVLVCKQRVPRGTHAAAGVGGAAARAEGDVGGGLGDTAAPDVPARAAPARGAATGSAAGEAPR